jgi:hypothetical protein
MLLTTTKNGPSVLYRLGAAQQQQQQQQQQQTKQDISKGIDEALRELDKSKGGRISLPMTHPAVQLLLPLPATTTRDAVRTVILQRISAGSCWMVISDQLLASYAKSDLKWLGRLARYVGEDKS